MENLKANGKLNGISRAEIKSLIEENSGKILKGVTSKLDYLIVGEKTNKKKVEKMLNSLILKLLTQEEWKKMLD